MNWKDKPYLDALKRMGRTRDGALIAESLRHVLAELGTGDGGALSWLEGRRYFAAELLRAMGHDLAVRSVPPSKPEESSSGKRLPGRRIGPEE